MSEIPRAIWEGEFELMGVRLKCYVLDNGERVIDANSVELFMAALEDPNAVIDQADVEKLARWRMGQ